MDWMPQCPKQWGKRKHNMYDERRGGGFDRPPREMHDALCSDCGQETQVPFKPDPERPVYCKDCYAKRRPPRF